MYNLKNENTHPNYVKPIQPAATPADSKKIQNYIYKFSDEIGKGNFSKVYKGLNEKTSI